MRFDAFVGGSYTLSSVTAAAQTSLNLYPEKIEVGGEKNSMRLVGTPGLTLFKDLSGVAAGARIRGLSSGIPGRLFVAIGTKYCEVDASGTVVAGPYTIVDDGVSPVYFFPNGNQLLVISAGSVYLDGGAGPIAVTLTPSGDPLTAFVGAFLDGYYIVARPDSKQFNISAINDGTSWDDLDFDMKSGFPDHIVGILADHQELWLFGTETTEIWRDTGAANFPFQRDPAAVLHVGCISPWSPVSISSGVAWLGGDSRGAAVAYLATGFTPQRVSTHAVEQQWRKTGAAAMAAATSFAYEEDGHWFWVITLAGSQTWVYDVTEGYWHERAYITDGGSRFSAKYQWHTFIPEWGTNGQRIVGDYLDPKLYIMSPDTTDDNGVAITRQRACPHIVDEQHRIFYHRMQIDMEVGPQIQTGGIAPSMKLDWSNDGGENYIAPARDLPDPRTDTTTRIIARQLGAGRDRVFRLTMRGTSKVAINNCYLEMSKGVS